MNKQTSRNIETLLTKIAQDNLFIETLETRHCDEMDFHDLAVWNIKAALMAAYEAGLQAAKQN